MDLIPQGQSAPPAVTHEQARLAMSHLLRTRDGEKAYWHQRDTHECILEEHPFGLETEILRLSGRSVDNRPRLIANPGYTDPSVDAMKLMLTHDAIKSRPWGDQVHFRLRIIRAQIAEDWDNPGKYVHEIYFELITGVGTFMCGGCSDCSGAGGSGCEELETIFQFVAALYQISVEEVVIPLAEAASARQKLSCIYSDFVKERSEMEAA